METNNSNRKPNVRQRECAVCGTPLTDGVCANCGWVEIIFPSEQPEAIKQFETARKSAAQRILDTRKAADSAKTAAEKKIGQLNTQIDQLNAKLGEANQTISSKNSEIGTLRRENEGLSSRPTSAKPLAYLIVDNNGVLSALGIAKGTNRVVNRRAVSVRTVPEGMNLIGGMFTESIDIEVTADGEGAFTIDSNLGNVEVDGKPMRSGQSLHDGKKITFERLPNLKIVFSIPKK